MGLQKRYDVIFWDVDGTLLNFLKSERYALNKCLEHYGLPSDEEIISTYSVINDKCWKMLERGEAKKSRILEQRFEELFLYLNSRGISTGDVSAKEFQSLYPRELGSVFYFQDDAKELLLKLKTDFKQYIITNGVEDTQRRKLKLSGITDIVEDLFISDCIGAEKPHPDFFAACMKSLPEELRNKSRILVVGDSLTSDMKGANNAGMDCCLYKSGEKKSMEKSKIGDAEIDYVIGHLWEVQDILWQNNPIKN